MEKNLKKVGTYIYVCNWFTLLDTWNLHGIINQLYSNIYFFFLSRNSCSVLSCSVYLILFYPMDCSSLGSFAHGILQARILEWVAIPFSRGSSQTSDWTQVSCIAGRFFTVWTSGESLGMATFNKYNFRKSIFYSKERYPW